MTTEVMPMTDGIQLHEIFDFAVDSSWRTARKAVSRVAHRFL